MVQISNIQQGAIKPQGIRTDITRPKQPEIDHTKENYKTFSETLQGFVKDVNDLQQEAGKSVEKLLTGEIKDVHDVMVAVEKAGTSFELMMELRNKMIEAYQEILRMQV